MGWRKFGLIFSIRKQKIGWLKSHAMLPSPVLLEDRIRVYFTGRDSKGHSRMGFVDMDSEDPERIFHVHDRPLLELGKIGTFDDSGTLGTWAVLDGERVFLYYNGYNRRVTVPWSNAIGLAVSSDRGVSFERMYEGPIVDRNAKEPYFAISPCILRENGVWHMWYTSGTGWILVNEVPEPLYVIKYGHSTDGIVWKREDLTCIYPLTPQEANARAAVIKEEGRYKMWFCYRGSLDFRDGGGSYRIGYAEADTPTEWVRCDERSGIAPGDGWDSKMQAYPAIVRVRERKYLFYNGNGFGAEGFGCAVWE
jgi:hypothetical protein